jgi:hypothetical protein
VEDKKQAQVSVNLDTTPILYTDNVLISANEDGVVLDVAQKVGEQLRLVARIGMSRIHAQKLVEKLGQILLVSKTPIKPTDKIKD